MNPTLASAIRHTRMTDADLKSAVLSSAQDSIGWRDSRLSSDRARALDLYYGRPFGNEMEGRSQVVSTDVADVVEWILPSLLRIFAGGSEVVRFEPTGPEDEEMARQASDYVNHIFNVDNPGFQILHSWFKDALLQKNGVVKVWWDESQEVNVERYARLAEPELVMLLADPDVQPVAHADHGDGFADITVQRRRPGGRVRITPVPTEEFLISRDARDLDSARFVGHRVLRTASDLIDDGFPRALVERLPAGGGLAWNAEALARMPDNDIGWPELGAESDPANRKIEVVEAYLRIDFDGDGIAELRQVTLAGDEVLVNQPVDAVPFADLTPIPMPHTWIGRSVADLVGDLQLIKSTILRQMLDNLYLANNARVEVVQDQVNLDDLLTSRPGGIVRVRQPGAVRPLVVPSIAGAAMPMLEFLDSVRENRTGVTRYNQGLDANSLNKTATGITSIMSASQQRLELVARVFAETGVKRLFKLILRLVARHQQAARIVRLRNAWVPMDPRSWNSGMDCTVTVGLGTGNREQTLGHMQILLNTMREVVTLQGGIGGPLVTFAQVRNVLTRYVEALGLKDSGQFFAEEVEAPAPPSAPEPDPAATAMELKLAELQAKAQLDQAKLALEARRIDIEERKAAHAAAIDASRLADGGQSELARALSELATVLQRLAVPVQDSTH